ncbi:MAG: NAD-dependent protein deacylase [Clostridia bacterium]|nr:NAD-dependent protein deacylase [Clostridia bacterium]
MDKIECLKQSIEKAKNICVFTGAGISCPSGIPDFRSADGLYNQDAGGKYSPEEIISHSFFVSHTNLFYDFYKSKMIYEDAKPNLAHRYFANLETKGKTLSVVTQNIDGLHQTAGSTKVFELHGSIHRNYCTKCGEFYSLKYILQNDLPICKKCRAVVKPDVVLYEEPLDENTIKGAINAIKNSDLMIVVGTSLTVYPAASFVRYFSGETLALINKSETSFDDMANITINDDIINVIKKLN